MIVSPILITAEEQRNKLNNIQIAMYNLGFEPIARTGEYYKGMNAGTRQVLCRGPGGWYDLVEMGY